MKRCVSIAFGLTMAMGLAACASLLGYDGLAPRGTDAEAPPDVSDVGLDSFDAAEFPNHPPGRPPGEAKPSGKGRTTWLIVRHFFLNSQNFDSLPSKDAWRDLGFDLDHVCTGDKEAKDNLGTCKRSPGANDKTLLDGNGCRDNNFGSQIIPLLLFVNGVFESDGNTAIENGRNTWILALEDLDDGPDDPYVTGSLYKAANWADFGTTKPKFDGTDVREVESESVTALDLGKPRTRFSKGYVRGNVWVSGEAFDFEVIVPFVGIGYQLPLVGATVTVRLSEDHKTAGLGILGGGLEASDLERIVAPFASAAGFCPGSTAYKSLLGQVATFVDVVAGAPNLQDPAKNCDTVSLGMGIAFASIKPVTRVVTDIKTSDKCVDAGVPDTPDASTDTDVPDGDAGDTKEGG